MGKKSGIDFAFGVTFLLGRFEAPTQIQRSDGMFTLGALEKDVACAPLIYPAKREFPRVCVCFG